MRRRRLPPAERRYQQRGPARKGPALGLLHACPGEKIMTPEERSELTLAFAKVLYVNGQATDQIVDAIRRLGRKLGFGAALLPRWGELQLRAENGEASPVPSYVAADPVGVDMDRVASAM